MKAVVITQFGAPEVLQIQTRTQPEPGPGQILVEVAAAGVNRADLLQRMGLYPAPPGTVQDVPGLEYSGVISALGEGAGGWKVGDEVMGLVPGGSMAEYLVVHGREAIRVPAGMPLAQAAGIPEAFLTAYDAAHLQCGLAMGDRVLVHAVGSGVGTALVQLARAAGAHVIGTSRTADKLERAAALGMQEGILAKSGSFEVPAEVDVVVDFVGHGYLDNNLRSLREGGTMIVVGLLGGVMDQINLATVLRRRLRILGTALRARPLEEKIALAQTFARRVVPGFEGAAPKFRPIVDTVLPMADAAAAHTALAQNATFGKIILTW